MLKLTIFIFFMLTALFSVSLSFAAYDYTPMENIPGFEGVKDFPEYISAIYKFGIWAIGIAALLMLSIGGFMYMTSAGNTSKLEKAKGVILDSILGVIVALAAYLLLYVINPDLVGGNISSLSGMSVPNSNTSVSYTPPPGELPTTSWPSDSVKAMSDGINYLSDADARALLSGAGINVNKSNCTSIGQSGCTSLDGIPKSAIDKLIKAPAGITTVTGGTEYWLHKSHGPGKSILDVTPVSDSILNSLIVNGGASPQSFCDLNGIRTNCNTTASHIHLVY